MRRKICLYTATRADWGLLRGLASEIRQRSGLTLQLLVSGAHLSPEFGFTADEIRADGFIPDETVEILLSADTPTAICKSMGLAMMGYGEALARLAPDLALVLGDRFETLCLASACQVLRTPLAHVHGGESTQGAMDEAFRHAITKLSHLHFASCEPYRQRIIQLGEAPDRVFNVGALGVENLKKIPLMDRDELSRAIGFDLEKPFFLVTFHPVTLEAAAAKDQCQALLDALAAMPKMRAIFTRANADTEGRIINQMFDDFSQQHPGQYLAVSSLGAVKYLSAMRYTSAVIGNSSSGIIEAPSFKVPTVNIGDRQKGRIQAGSILNCPPEAAAIENAMETSLSDSFRAGLNAVVNPYDRKGTASAIAETLATADIPNLGKKKFHDIL